MRRKVIVKFVRPLEKGSLTGYVLDIGKTFFLFAVLDDGLEFEHYSCLRIADVRSLESPAAHEAFYKAVRKKRGDKVPKKIRVDLTNALSILRTLHPSLVTVHRERVAPDTCIIGRTTSDNGIDFEFLEIDPYAQWNSEPTYYRINQVTRVDLPGLYERALMLVGGEPQFKPGTFE
jgi:hypothetical protein